MLKGPFLELAGDHPHMMFSDQNLDREEKLVLVEQEMLMMEEDIPVETFTTTEEPLPIAFSPFFRTGFEVAGVVAWEPIQSPFLTSYRWAG